MDMQQTIDRTVSENSEVERLSNSALDGAEQKRSQPRMDFVDLLRGVALLFMLEAHPLHTFILPEVRQAPYFKTIDLIHGVPATAFLFISGFVFVVNSMDKTEEFQRFGPVVLKSLKRIGLIWSVAYLLHLPDFGIDRILARSSHEDWLRYLQVDILHCIAVGLTVLLAGKVILRSEVQYSRVMLVLAVSVFLVSPFFWTIDFSHVIPPVIAAYLNNKHYSLFPIFPYLGYLLLGAGCAWHYVQSQRQGCKTKFFKKAALIGIGLISLSYLSSLTSITNNYYFNYGNPAGPVCALYKLAAVLLAFAVSWYFTGLNWLKKSFVYDIGRESFFVYTTHLIILYHFGLQKPYEHSLGIIECILIAVVFTAVMTAAAVAWGRLKKGSPKAFRRIFYAITAALLFYKFL